MRRYRVQLCERNITLLEMATGGREGEREREKITQLFTIPWRFVNYSAWVPLNSVRLTGVSSQFSKSLQIHVFFWIAWVVLSLSHVQQRHVNRRQSSTSVPMPRNMNRQTPTLSRIASAMNCLPIWWGCSWKKLKVQTFFDRAGDQALVVAACMDLIDRWVRFPLWLCSLGHMVEKSMKVWAGWSKL